MSKDFMWKKDENCVGEQMSATGGDITGSCPQNHGKPVTVISAKNLGGPLAKSEKIAEDPEKALHFPGKDGTFFNSENAYVSCFACTSVNGHRKNGAMRAGLSQRPGRLHPYIIIF